MVLSSIDVWQRIANEGLASPMQCRSWAAELAKSMPVADATDGLKVLQGLIGLGKLTNYQAKILAGQSNHPLRRGAWTILQKVKDPLWPHWLEVTQIDLTKGEPPPAAWVRWLNATDMADLRSSAPSLPRGLQFASVRHPALQAVAVPSLHDGELQLHVAPIHGRLLSDLYASERPAPEAVTRILRQVAEALAALHAANIVHGRVLPDRIYLDDEQVTLACDPISALTATLDRSAIGLLGERLGNLSCEQFFAPEFITPGQTPTFATDVYALGCTWYWLLTGEAVASGTDRQQILAKQTEAAPKLVASLTYPEPLARCLYHCLGKNLSARFATASELSAAFAKALETIASGKKRVAEVQPTPVLKPITAPVPVEIVQPEIKIPANEKRAEKPISVAEPIAKEKRPARTGEIAIKPSPNQQASGSPTAGKPTANQPVPAQPNKHVQSIPVQLVAEQPVQNRTLPEPSVAGDTANASASAGVSLSQLVPPVERPTQRRKKRRGPRAANKWLLPVAGGCIFVMILLLVLKLSGALEPRQSVADKGQKPAYTPPNGEAPKLVERDPRLDAFQLVAPNAERLWAPPELPQPIPLDMLPPGGQLFISFRPSDLLNHPQRKHLLVAMDEQLTPLIEWTAGRAGQPIEAIEQATVAFYSATTSGDVPQAAIRIKLATAKSLGELKELWQNPTPSKIGEHELLVADATAYYVAAQPLTNAQSVVEFSCGPAELMKEVAELQGATGPLIAPMEKLWQRSDHRSDLSLLVSPRYLFSEGRGIFATAPTRLTEQLKALLSTQTVAALLQSRLEPRWYIEAQIIGNADRDASQLATKLQSEIANSPARIEKWLVNQSPHPYWRGLAIRFPQMLRMASQYTRVGVEDGVAIANAYLPVEAAPNLMLASWIALQDGATLAGELPSSASEAKAMTPLTLDEYLGRSIRLSFDQEPIEVALRLIGEEANADLPLGTASLRFVLDGSAFELAGITRNQQVRDFNMNGKSVRESLTELAKRGNPVTTVQDTREEDQRLIWVIADDPESPGKQIVSLTTREAANTTGIALPVEFAP